MHLTRRDVLTLSLMSFALPSQMIEPALAIEDVTIVGDGGLQRDRMVLVKGSRIAEVTSSRAVRAPEGVRTVDGRGKYLIPGLWDMHGHLSYTKASALAVLLANGVTGLRDCGGVLDEIDGWRSQIHSGTRKGPRIFRCGPALTARSSEYQRGVATEAEGRHAVEELARAGVDFIKVHAAIPREAYWGVAAATKRVGLAFVGHLPRALSAADASDAGQAGFEHVDTLLDGKLPADGTARETAATIARFGEHEGPRLFERLARNGTWFTPTLCVSTFPYLTRLAAWSNGQPPPPQYRYVSRASRKVTAEIAAKYQKELAPAYVARYEATFAEYLKLVGAMHAAGVRLLAGSDFATAVTYPGFDLHEELYLLVRAGLPAHEALAAATRNPATHLQQRDGGAVVAGNRADLVLLDRDPLTDIRHTREIRAVVCGGVLLMRGDLDALLAMAEQEARGQ